MSRQVVRDLKRAVRDGEAFGTNPQRYALAALGKLT